MKYLVGHKTEDERSDVKALLQTAYASAITERADGFYPSCAESILCFSQAFVLPTVLC